MIQTLPLVSGLSGAGYCADCNGVATTRRADGNELVEMCETCANDLDQYNAEQAADIPGADGVRIDENGRLLLEGVAWTIDGPDWTATELTYRPTREEIPPAPSRCLGVPRCGLFLHHDACPMRPSRLG